MSDQNVIALPITGLTAGTSVQATDVYPAVDTTDFTQATTGTTKKYTVNQLASFIGNGGIGWTTVTSATQTMIANHGYILNRASGCTFTLPVIAPLGSVIYLTGINTGLWTLAQLSGQQILFGSTQTTAGASGSLAATNARDSIYLVCVIGNDVTIPTNVTWTTIAAPQGIITVV